MKKNIKDFFISLGIIIGFFFVNSFIYELFKTFINEELSEIISLIITSFGLFFILIKNNNKSLKDTNIKKYIIIFIILFIITEICNYFFSNIFHINSNNELLIKEEITTHPYLSLIKLITISPFYEELLFRLNFKKVFKNKYVFSIVTAIIFALIHLISANNILDFIYIIPYGIMGYFLAYVFIDSDNIYNSILFHSLNNILAYIVIIIGGVL